jgi:adenylate cyclase
VLSHPGAAAHRVVRAKKTVEKKWRNLSIAVGSVIFIVAVVLGVWRFFLQPPSEESASVEKMAYPLPDKPSIAVLPFVNMSGDPEQDYFSDGITEEIITALSKTPKMLVIARNSTFSYKGRSVKIKEVAEDLGVQYVLEGSVRKEGDRIRINAQLIDSITGHHLWAERYDRDLKDVFALQDEISIRIISALRVNLTDGEIAHLFARRTQNLEAYLKVLKAREYFMRLNQKDNTLAQRWIKEAIALDSEYAFPYALLGWTHFMDVWYRTSNSPKESISRAFKLAQKALSMDDSLVNAHGLLAYIYTFKRQYEKAIAEAEQSLAIDPNFADGHCHKARTLHYVGRNEESIELIRKAIRLNPFPPSYYYYQLGYCYFMTEQYEQSIAEFKKAIKLQSDNLPAFVGIAAVYGFSDQKKEALLAGKEVSRVEPEFFVQGWVKRLPYKNEADIERLRSGLYKAGLPE